MSWIMHLLRSMFCRHEWRHHANLYGDQINAWNGKRSVWECSRCGTLQGRDQLHDANADPGDLRGVAGPLPERGWD